MIIAFKIFILLYFNLRVQFTIQHTFSLNKYKNKYFMIMHVCLYAKHKLFFLKHYCIAYNALRQDAFS